LNVPAGRAEELAHILAPLLEPGESLVLIVAGVDDDDVVCDAVSACSPPVEVCGQDMANIVCELGAAMQRELNEGRTLVMRPLKRED